MCFSNIEPTCNLTDRFWRIDLHDSVWIPFPIRFSMCPSEIYWYRTGTSTFWVYFWRIYCASHLRKNACVVVSRRNIDVDRCFVKILANTAKWRAVPYIFLSCSSLCWYPQCGFQTLVSIYVAFVAWFVVLKVVYGSPSRYFDMIKHFTDTSEQI